MPEIPAWCVPVAVRRSSFTPVKPEHLDFNVETDLSQPGSYHFASGTVPAEDLLVSDCQTVLRANEPGRLGSGRSGFYRGKYLKGVGRTPLAANWNLPGDAYHASGHLFPSGAIREYVVSCYFRARGAEARINPCEGLLLRPLDRSIEAYLDRVFFDRDTRPSVPLAPVDLKFQAISVKPGGFARHSNFVWYVDHILGDNFPGYLIDFVAAFRYFLEGGAGAAPASKADADLSPDDIVDALERATARTFDNFLEFFRLGVSFGSYPNNYCLDGRFLDLELPTIFAKPCFGAQVASVDDELSSCDEDSICGLEAFHVLSDMRRFVQHLVFRCEFFLRNCASEKPIRAFLDGLSAGLRERMLGAGGPLDGKRVAGRVCEMISTELELPAKAARKLRAFVMASLARDLEGSSRPLPDVGTFRRAPFTLAPQEPTFLVNLYAPAALGPPPAQSEASHAINQLLLRLDHITDLDRLLGELAGVEDEVRRIVS